MTATNKILKLVDILITNGETSREELMEKLDIHDIGYFNSLLTRARETQGIHNYARAGVVYYRINTNYPVTLDLFSDLQPVTPARERYRAERRNEPLT